MSVTIEFNSQEEALALCQHLYGASVEENNLIINSLDYAAFYLALSLENINKFHPEIRFYFNQLVQIASQSEVPNSDVPRIYVACLSSWSYGHEHGVWLDATQDLETLRNAINFLLFRSPVKEFEACEDYAIFEFENFQGFSLREYESLENVHQIAKGIAKHGKAYSFYLEEVGIESASEEDFSDRYLGCWGSVVDYVEDYYESSGIAKAVEQAGLEAYYIDYHAIARDWELGRKIVVHQASADEFYIFSN